MTGHSCTTAVLAFEDCGLAAVQGNTEGVADVRLGESGGVDVV
jgi:hypothetical protein